MVCPGVLGSISGLSWGALWCLGVVVCRCVPRSAKRLESHNPLCVRECVFAHVDGLFFLAWGHKTHPSSSLVSEGDGMGSLPLPTGLPAPPRPALLQLPLPRGHRAVPSSESPRVSRTGLRPGSQAGCHLRTERWGTLGRKLAEPQDLRGHGRGAGDWPGGPATEKTPAGAGEEGGRLGTGAGGNWHRTHGAPRRDAVVPGLQGE